MPPSTPPFAREEDHVALRQRAGREPPEGADLPPRVPYRDWTQGTAARHLDDGALTLRVNERADEGACGGAVDLLSSGCAAGGRRRCSASRWERAREEIS